jgi:hypothetical protein
MNLTTPSPLPDHGGGIWIGIEFLTSTVPSAGDDYIFCILNNPLVNISIWSCVDGYLDSSLNFVADNSQDLYNISTIAESISADNISGNFSVSFIKPY